MRIHQTARGFVILRGVRDRQFFAFWVDGDRASWTKSVYGARVYALRDSAAQDMWEIKEINLRRRLKVDQVEYA